VSNSIQETDGRTDIVVRPSVSLLDWVWNERMDGQTDAGNRIWCICDIWWQ